MHSIATTAPSLQGSLAGVLPSTVVASRRAVPLALLRVLGNALLLMSLLALNMAGDPGAWAFFVILSVMVFVSPEAAFKSLAICYLGLMVNSYFVPKSLVWTPGRIILPFLALFRFGVDLAVYRLSLLNRAAYVGLLCFCAVMTACSMLSGWYTQIALLKIVYFLSFVTMVWAAVTVLRHRNADLGEWVVSLSLATALFGIGSIALGIDNNFRALRVDVYQTIYGTAFNGALNHPNAHAVYATMFIMFLAIVWLLSLYRQRWLVLPLMACWGVFTVWSASRTAVLALVPGVLGLVFYARPMRSRFGWRLRPRVKRLTLVSIGAAAIILALFYDASTDSSLGKAISSYLVKGAVRFDNWGGDVNLERILTSRRALIEYSWNNFLENPLTGIGFGVAKTENFRRMATYLTAPAEKGFLPSAILEEGGLFGAGAFVLFVGLFTRDLMRDRNVAGLIMFVVFLASNFGEVTIFAPGGAGAFGWIMVGAGTVFGDRCWAPPVTQSPAVAGRVQWRLQA